MHQYAFGDWASPRFAGEAYSIPRRHRRAERREDGQRGAERQGMDRVVKKKRGATERREENGKRGEGSKNVCGERKKKKGVERRLEKGGEGKGKRIFYPQTSTPNSASADRMLSRLFYDCYAARHIKS